MHKPTQNINMQWQTDVGDVYALYYQEWTSVCLNWLSMIRSPENNVVIRNKCVLVLHFKSTSASFYSPIYLFSSLSDSMEQQDMLLCGFSVTVEGKQQIGFWKAQLDMAVWLLLANKSISECSIHVFVFVFVCLFDRFSDFFCHVN